MPKKPTKPSNPTPTLRDRAEEGVRVSTPDSARMSPGKAERMVHELKVHQIELEMQNEELPDMDGYATLGKIRQSPEFLTLPIIAATAKRRCPATGRSACRRGPTIPSRSR